MVSWAVRLSVKPGSRLKFWDLKYHLYILGKKSFASSTSSHLTHSLPWFKYSPKTFVIVRHSLAVLVILIVAENTFSHMSSCDVEWRENTEVYPSCCSVRGQLQREERS